MRRSVACLLLCLLILGAGVPVAARAAPAALPASTPVPPSGRRGGDPAVPTYPALPAESGAAPAAAAAGPAASGTSASGAGATYSGHSGLNPYGLYSIWAPDELFIADTGGKLDQYLFADQSPLTFDLPISRYYGPVDSSGHLQNQAEAQARGILPTHATLLIRVFDVDDDYQGDDVAPEVDILHVNDCVMQAPLSSGNDTWSTLTYEVPLDCLRFPAAGAYGQAIQPAQNRIAVDIDTANGGQIVWAVEVDWAAIALPAVRPAVLVNGILSSAKAWTTFRGFLDAAGLPYQAISVGGWSSIASNTDTLLAEIPKVERMFGVKRVNIIAHSKGGLDSRSYMRYRDDVDALVQLGTPNRGSECATILAGYAFPMTRNLRPDWIFEHFNYRQEDGHWVLDTPEQAVAPIYIYAGTAYSGRRCMAGLGLVNVRLDPPHDGVVSTDRATLPWHWTGVDGDGIDQGTVDARISRDHSGLHEDRSVADQAIAWLVASQPHGVAALRVPAATGQTATAGVPPTTAGGRAGRAPAAGGAAAAPPGASPQGTPSDPAPDLAIIQDSVGALSDGQTTSLAVPVSGQGGVRFQLAYSGGTPDFSVVRPDGQVLTPATAAGLNATYEEEQGLLQGADYRVESPPAGTWTLRLTAHGNLDLYELSAAEAAPPYLTAWATPAEAAPNQPVTLQARLSDSGGAPVSGAKITAQVRAPDGSLQEITLHDDGQGSDATAGDGVYSGTAQGSADGYYPAVITADLAGSGQRLTVTEYAVAGASARLVSNLSDSGMDTDGDGLYDELQVGVDVAVQAPGRYLVEADLADATGAIVATGTGSLESAAPGTWRATLHFNGRRIYSSGRDGPYNVSGIRLTSAEGLHMGTLAGAYVTRPYSHTLFQHARLRLGGGSELAQDLDSDGYYDRLRIDLGLDSDQSGWHLATARLVTGDGRTVQWVAQNVYLYAGHNTVHLDFDGRNIRRSGYDGSFRVTDLSVQGSAGPLIVVNAYQTGAYRHNQFTPIPTDLWLGAGDITVAPAAPVPGTATTLAATVRNAGAAAGPFQVAFYLGYPLGGGQLIGSQEVSSIAAEDTAQAQVAWTTPARSGTYTLCVLVNADWAVTEYDYSNNTACTSVQVVSDTSPPTIQYPAYAATYQRGEAIAIQWTASDDGSGLASTAATLDGNPVSAGEQVTPSAGRHTLVFTAIDRAGNTARQTVRFTVYNLFAWLPPLAATGTAAVAAGDDLKVQFSASDVGGHFVADQSVKVTVWKGSQPVASYVCGNTSRDVQIGTDHYELVLHPADLGFGPGDRGQVQVYFGSVSHGIANFQQQ